jgi:predicted RNA-binding protein YlxR (DUF448 family)
MTAAAHKLEEDENELSGSFAEGSRDESRERRDLVSGEVMPEHRLIRFVAAPDGTVVPDAAAKLPGRGLWVEATRKAINTAVEKKLFSRAARAQVNATADLADRAEKALIARIIGDLGIARRSGTLVLGFDNVLRALDGPKAPPDLLIEASDGAKDGKRKLYNAAHARALKPAVAECLTSAELGLALGRENVIHAAVHPGGLAERLTLDTQRLTALRIPARNESPRSNASKTPANGREQKPANGREQKRVKP